VLIAIGINNPFGRIGYHRIADAEEDEDCGSSVCPRLACSSDTGGTPMMLS
jgi:hypothetical protein